MRLSQGEKYEIIRLVEESTEGVNKTLKELGIGKSTFYSWYNRFLEKGYEGLSACKRNQNRVWNKIPQQEKNKIVELALNRTELSPRELAFHYMDTEKRHVCESSVYRILKERGLITSPAFILLAASDEFKNKTTRVNEMWQTDFSYFRVIGWGNYYLCTVIDDYSRFIIAWDLCENMQACDAQNTVDKALFYSRLDKNNMPRLLSDNGSCFIAHEFRTYLKANGIKQINGRPMHPQTQGKIERYHRTMKNIVKLDNYYSPGELRKALEEFVSYYNHRRYHESINNVTPADMYFGRAERILQRRVKIKNETMNRRREDYLKQKQFLRNKEKILTLQ